MDQKEINIKSIKSVKQETSDQIDSNKQNIHRETNVPKISYGQMLYQLKRKKEKQKNNNTSNTNEIIKQNDNSKPLVIPVINKDITEYKQTQRNKEICFSYKQIKEYFDQVATIQYQIFGKQLTTKESHELQNNLLNQQFIQEPCRQLKQARSQNSLDFEKNMLLNRKKNNTQFQFKRLKHSQKSIFKKQQKHDNIFLGHCFHDRISILSKKLGVFWKDSSKYHPILLVKIYQQKDQFGNQLIESFDLSNKTINIEDSFNQVHIQSVFIIL